MDDNRYLSPKPRSEREENNDDDKLMRSGLSLEQITKMSKASESDFISPGVGAETDRQLREEQERKSIVLEMATVVQNPETCQEDIKVIVEETPAKTNLINGGDDAVEGEETDTTAKGRRVFEVNTTFQKEQKDRQYPNNTVSTTKYTCANFLPKNLFEQFSKMANFYFLFLIFLQLIPGIGQPYGSLFTFMPLSFVVTISMVKDAYEDNQRRIQDHQENNFACDACPRGSKSFSKMRSLELQVGCIVKVYENQNFPADLVLIQSSLPKGIGYVETKNLDGETNLKQKQANLKILEHAGGSPEVALSDLMGAQIECETPNEYLYKFEGNFVLKDGTKIPMEPDQILLKGSTLRNTEYVVGICVFTGHDTKIMQNSSKGEIKRSKNAKKLNSFVLFTMAIQFIFSVIGSSILTVWTEYNGEEDWYLYPKMTNNDTNMVYQGFYNIGVWFIALMNFVPISLLVTLESINFLQAKFITYDFQIFDEERFLPAKVQSSNLNEELGMVHYIFSDKTGTLTQNIMEFQKFTVGTHKFGLDKAEGVVYADGVTNVNFDDPELYRQLDDQSHPNHSNVKRFLEALGLCHTVITDIKTKEKDEIKAETKTGTKEAIPETYIVYNASSPDELALVNGARHLGFAFDNRDEEGNMVCKTWDGEKSYKLLNVIEFDSTRKRMTVIVRSPENKIFVICKGADSIIEKRLRKDSKETLLDQTKVYLDEFAKTGLRTLLIAAKEVSEEEYQAWSMQYLKAATSINKETEINRVSELIEFDFELLGSTAIEDKLQENVGETIFDIRKAGIQVWVLTGDKVETAINIGHACKLLETSMNMFIMQSVDLKEVEEQIARFYEQQAITKALRDNAVIVAGETLSLIQQHKALEQKFIDLCEGANVVLACRVSPKQKAEVVLMIKTRHPENTTLAIGDGANDVNMINAAHIGVGISGLEGQQAVKASDYAIGKFKFLKNLLFVHGREAYRRNSYATCYIFYKNILETGPIFFFGIWSIFSGTPIYHLFLYNAFNPVFTSMPIIWFGTMDFEHSKEKLMSDPKLYKYGLRNLHFNTKIFLKWVLYAFGQSLLIMVFSFYSIVRGSQNQEGKYGGLVDAGDFVFACIVFVANTKVLVSAYQINFGIIFSVLFCSGLYVASYATISGTFITVDQFGSMGHLATFPSVYFAFAFFITTFGLIDTGIDYLRRWLKIRRLQADFQEERARKNREMAQPNLIKKRITQYKHTGFAFSQDAGQDKLVTDALTKMAQDKVMEEIERQTSNLGIMLKIPYN